MQRTELLHLARVGAEKRLQALKDEMESIFRHFPELRRSRGARAAAGTPGNGAATRGPRKMSAAARKRISDAQKKRWKAWRKTRSA
jgi:hypothetical protein